MKLYKDGHEVYAEKDQVELLIEDGWSKVKPSKKVVQPEPEETTDDEIMDDEEVIEGDESEEETEDGGESSEPQAAPKKIGKKAIAKKK